MAKQEKRARDGSLNNFVRLEIGFVLTDLRYRRLSDLAARLYLHLACSAIANRREILPPEITPESIAWDMHKDDAVLGAALDELLAGPRPLVSRLEDGRIRVVGVRKLHGNQFKWRDEPELHTTATSDNVHTTNVVHTCDDRAPTLHVCTTSSQEEEKEEEEEKEKEAPAHTSHDRATLPEMTALMTATAAWKCGKTQDSIRLWALKPSQLYDHTARLVGAAMLVNDRDVTPIRHWKALKDVYDDPNGVPREYIEKARELIAKCKEKRQKQPEVALSRDPCAGLKARKGGNGSVPASIGEILSYGNGKQNPLA